MTKADYESQVEQVFRAYVDVTRQPLAAGAKASLRKLYRVYDGDEEALLELKDTLTSAAVVDKARKADAKMAVTQEDAKPKRPKAKSQKCLDRRYHIVAFVTDRLPKSGRPDWKRIVTEWNATHPLDQVSRDLLKVEYNRALREWDIVFQYLVATRDDRPFREMLQRVKGPTVTQSGDPALKWLQRHGGNFIKVIEKETIVKDEEAK